jgi:hypothetical protein
LSKGQLRPARREELLELPAVKPNTAALGAGVDDNGPLNGAIDSHEIRAIARAAPLFAFGQFVAAPATERRHLAGILSEQLTEFLRIEPDSVARRTTVHGHFFHEKFAKSLSIALGTVHFRPNHDS